MKLEDIQILRQINQSSYVLISKDIKTRLGLKDDARVKITVESAE